MSQARVDAMRIPDRFDIEQLMFLYAKSADLADIETQSSIFVDDCRVSYSNGRWFESREELKAGLRAALTRYAKTSHQVSNIQISFTGVDTASAESVITAWHRDVSGKEWTLHGRYVDEWVRAMEGWKLKSRIILAAGATGRDEESLMPLPRRILSDGD